jgi:uncharacterized protein (DUF2132 family)
MRNYEYILQHIKQFLGNGSLNASPRKLTRTQQWYSNRFCVFYVVRAENLQARRGLELSPYTKIRIFNNMLYVLYVHLAKGQAYPQEITPSSHQRKYYVRTMTARVQSKKKSDRGSQAASRQDELLAVHCQS